MVLSTALLTLVLFGADSPPACDPPFEIVVVDRQTGRGVPLVELRTVNNIRCFTDSNGIVAFREPGLMGQKVYFHVSSHGYEYPADGFGYRGQALDVVAGGRARLELTRINIAERLYRLTGGGIYADSVLVGRPVPTRAPVLNGLVFGSDSVLNTVYRGKIYWFWGDTSRPAYPLGNFHVPGATSVLPKDGGLDPGVGVDLTYFLDDQGFAKPTAQMPGDGPTWISSLVTLPDAAGVERMFASYAKIKPGSLETYERGLVVFNDEKQAFEKVVVLDLAAPLFPEGHPFKHRVDGVGYVYFPTPYPLTRVRADVAALQRLSDYEAYTCLVEGSRAASPELDRDADGRLRYGWKKNTPPLRQDAQAKLIEAGTLKASEALLGLQDRDTGKTVLAHGASVYWNAFRQRWVMITVEFYGTSLLGEVWYAEADTPLGPWVYAIKVVTHDRYSFYNPKQHPVFAQDGGRVIFFEGTYTNSFSGNPDQTPRYEYNQVMYRLDLADPRLALPVPVYGSSADAGAESMGLTRRRGPVAFFALDRTVAGSVAMLRRKTADGGFVLRSSTSAEAGEKDATVFHALPADTKEPPATTVPLYEWVSENGGPAQYAIDPGEPRPGYRRSAEPVCRVWRNPLGVTLPPDEAGGRE